MAKQLPDDHEPIFEAYRVVHGLRMPVLKQNIIISGFDRESVRQAAIKQCAPGAQIVVVELRFSQTSGFYEPIC